MVNRSLKRSPTPFGEAVLASIFPGRRDFRVPVVAVVSDADASDLVRQIARAIGATGLDVVATHGKGYEFGELNFGTGDFATLAGSTRAFFDRSAEAIVVGRRAEELAEEGFGIGFADVAVFCPPDEGDEAFWRQAGFLAGIANAAFAVDSGTSRADRTGSAPQGVDWLAGEQAQTDPVAAGIAERLSAIAEKGRPAAAARNQAHDDRSQAMGLRARVHGRSWLTSPAATAGRGGRGSAAGH